MTNPTNETQTPLTVGRGLFYFVSTNEKAKKKLPSAISNFYNSKETKEVRINNFVKEIAGTFCLENQADAITYLTSKWDKTEKQDPKLIGHKAHILAVMKPKNMLDTVRNRFKSEPKETELTKAHLGSLQHLFVKLYKGTFLSNVAKDQKKKLKNGEAANSDGSPKTQGQTVTSAVPLKKEIISGKKLTSSQTNSSEQGSTPTTPPAPAPVQTLPTPVSTKEKKDNEPPATKQNETLIPTSNLTSVQIPTQPPASTLGNPQVQAPVSEQDGSTKTPVAKKSEAPVLTPTQPPASTQVNKKQQTPVSKQEGSTKVNPAPTSKENETTTSKANSQGTTKVESTQESKNADKVENKGNSESEKSEQKSKIKKFFSYIGKPFKKIYEFFKRCFSAKKNEEGNQKPQIVEENSKI